MMTNWYCKHCGELSLRLICEHCGKPRDTRLRIAVLHLFGLVLLPVCMYGMYYVGNVIAPEMLTGYDPNFPSLIGLASIFLIIPVGYGWLMLLYFWYRDDKILRDYWSKKHVVR